MKNFHKFFLPSIIFPLILASVFLCWNTPIIKAQTNPLSFPDLTTALNTKLPNKYFKNKAELINWLITEIKKRKVDKPLSADRESDLRQIGATDQLIEVIRTNSPTFKNPALAKPPYRMEFIKVPAGSFMMGSNDRYDEKPVHKVTLTKDIWMQKTEVTQSQWKAIMGSLPSTKCYDAKFSEDFLGDNKPVVCVSWDSVQDFIKGLNAKKDGYKYRLPTEAEWEYAARAGGTDKYNGDLNEIAWFGINAEEGGHPYDVATKKPNSWGLYDTLGNVAEWTSDWYANYTDAPQINPSVTKTAVNKVVRGGSWGSAEYNLSSAARFVGVPTKRADFIGFRLVREK